MGRPEIFSTAAEAGEAATWWPVPEAGGSRHPAPLSQRRRAIIKCIKATAKLLTTHWLLLPAIIQHHPRTMLLLIWYQVISVEAGTVENWEARSEVFHRKCCSQEWLHRFRTALRVPGTVCK